MGKLRPRGAGWCQTPSRWVIGSWAGCLPHGVRPKESSWCVLGPAVSAGVSSRHRPWSTGSVGKDVPVANVTGPVGDSYLGRWGTAGEGRGGGWSGGSQARECLGSNVRAAVGRSWAGWRAGRRALIFLGGSRDGATQSPLGSPARGTRTTRGPGASPCSGVCAGGRDQAPWREKVAILTSVCPVTT